MQTERVGRVRLDPVSHARGLHPPLRGFPESLGDPVNGLEDPDDSGDDKKILYLEWRIGSSDVPGQILQGSG